MTKTTMMAIACLVLATSMGGVTAQMAWVPVGSGGSTADGACGSGASWAKAETRGMMPSAGADAGGDEGGTTTTYEWSTENSARAEADYSGSGLTWAESSAQHATELWGAAFLCDMRRAVEAVKEAIGQDSSFQTGCLATTDQTPAIIQGTFGSDDEGNLYIIGHRSGDAFTHVLNNVTFLPDTASQPIPPDTSILGGALSITFTENSCSVLAA